MCNDFLIDVTYTVVPMSERPYNLRCSVLSSPSLAFMTRHTIF